jgi:hypothetical protein
MSQASGSRHSLGYIEEVVFGTTPATPAFKGFRHNSTSLNLNRAAFGSEELRPDRMIADYRAGTKSVEGNVVTELSQTSHDDMLAAALCGTWVGNVLKAGSVRKSFSLERHFQDINEFLRYRGAQVDTLQISMTTGAVVGLTFGYWAKGMDVAQAIIVGATYPAAPSTPTMDAISGSITENGIPIAVATEVTLNLANNLNPRFVIGSAESLEPSIGRSNLTGTLSAYFESSVLYQKFLTNADSSLEVVCSDGTESFTFLVPKLKYTGGDVPVSGEGPVSIQMPFQGILDPVTGTNFQITRSAP